jgi:DNA-binding transcriptional MerR regulator
MTAGWTLDELVRRAGEALAAQHVRVPNGRVTALPDRRVVRWYSTIGLVDRPAAYRGRTALYGPRHLRQVVAVKRRQAEGRSLAEIQAELTGATDSTLREVAQLPDELPAPASRPRFWAESPSRPPAVPGGKGGSGGGESGSARESLDQREEESLGQRGETGEMRLWYGVALRPGVTLMLPTQPGTDDLTEIRAAARPLLDLLAQRGLLNEGG